MDYKQKLVTELNSRGLTQTELERAKAFCNERVQQGASIEQLYNVLTKKKQMHTLTVLGQKWFNTLLKEIS